MSIQYLVVCGMVAGSVGMVTKIPLFDMVLCSVELFVEVMGLFVVDFVIDLVGVKIGNIGFTDE